MPTHISLSAAATTFKGPDGMLNFEAVQKLNTQIEAILKKAGDKAIPVASYYVIAVKAKPIKYSAALEKKDDLKYHLRRATKIVARKRITPASVGKVKTLLTVVTDPALPAALRAKIKEAAKAIEMHLKKMVKVKEVVSKKKGKIRDAGNAAFDTAVGHLKEVLLDGGIKERDIVETTGMFGKSVLVKLNAESVVSIGKADITRFNAARRAANTSTSSSSSLYDWAQPMMKTINLTVSEDVAPEDISAEDGAYVTATEGKSLVSKFRKLGYKVTEKPTGYFIVQSKLEAKAGLLLEFREEELIDGEGMCRLNFKKF